MKFNENPRPLGRGVRQCPRCRGIHDILKDCVVAAQLPAPDWNKMFPNINEKYSDLLQSHSSLCGEIEQKGAYIRELSDALEETRKERDTLNLQNGELAEAKGNLLDFVLSVRLWATGQPTGKSIKESCDKMLEHYAEKPKSDCGHNYNDPANPCPICTMERLARIENGKCPECGQKVHLHNCTGKRKDDGCDCGATVGGQHHTPACPLFTMYRRSE